MSASLSDNARRILDGKNFAVVVTLNQDGSPQSSVVWIQRRDDDTIEFSSTSTRRKVRNLQRDPRLTLSIFDLSDPYTSVDITGTAELVPDPDKRLPADLSHKYLGQDAFPESADIERYIVRITPTRETGFTV